MVWVMKRILYIMLAASVLLFAACDKYDDGRPGRELRKEFNAMYPDARDVEWEREGAYWVVSFEIDRVDHEAWYDESGNWVRTVRDVTLASVPAYVLSALENSVYGGSFPDNDVDYVMTPAGNFYRFEIMFEGREVKVDVSEGGEVSLAGYDY